MIFPAHELKSARRFSRVRWQYPADLDAAGARKELKNFLDAQGIRAYIKTRTNSVLEIFITNTNRRNL